MQSGNPRELFSVQYRTMINKARAAQDKNGMVKKEMIRISRRESERIKGTAISKEHCKGWRCDLKSLMLPAEIEKMISDCWNDEPSRKPTFREIFGVVDKWDDNLFVI
tara:strand:- start:32 stop:355 length:324 start_codon:yes stop_codon:yes gene_type:complete